MTTRQFSVRFNPAYRAPGSSFTSTSYSLRDAPPATIIEAENLDALLAQIEQLGEARGEGCAASITPLDRSMRKWPHYDKRTLHLTFNVGVKPAAWVG
jgi:hypothetical protein